MFDYGKDCGGCSRYLPRSKFNLSRSNKDGKQTQCAECHAKKNRDIYAADPSAAKARSRVWKQENRARYIHRAARYRASKNGLAFTVSIEEVAAHLALGVCALSGLPFDLTMEGHAWDAPSLDRKRDGEGYTSSNIRIIIWGLNAAFCHWGEDITANFMRAWLANRKD